MSTFVLGAGFTGLAAGLASGCPVFEASMWPGGICCSYYVRPGSPERIHQRPPDCETYRFELGGGHWIFGGDPTILRFVAKISPLRHYSRRSAVFFPDRKLYVPYPLQDHLRFLGADISTRALREMARPAAGSRTMKEWLVNSFGQTLCELFFEPFHDLYMAGLHAEVASQDAYKTPVDLARAIKGAFAETAPVGYNTTFVYPEEGLDAVARWMAARSDVRYGKTVVSIDGHRKVVSFSDGTNESYDLLLSSLPLNRVAAMVGLSSSPEADPFTSVLVLNIGAVRGADCPNEHWVYLPRSVSGFHRAGFYSNVDPDFLPASQRSSGRRVSLYVERTYRGGVKPTEEEVARYAEAVAEEFRSFRIIGEVEVLDPTWIEVAYTWSRPGSVWVKETLRALEAMCIFQIGRYGRWAFQGIADSIREGFAAGAAFKDWQP